MAERALVAIRGYWRRRPSLGGPSSANLYGISKAEPRRSLRHVAQVTRPSYLSAEPHARRPQGLPDG
jgi:hypothetical protein